MAQGKPQRRTLVKALRNLVDHVNWDIFNALDSEELERYKPLLLAVNEAERLLDRERRCNATERARKRGLTRND